MLIQYKDSKEVGDIFDEGRISYVNKLPEQLNV